MRRYRVFLFAFLLAALAPAGWAAQDKLEGRWEGKVSMPLGERDAAVTFKKEGNGYTGSTTGLRGDLMPFKEVKVDGNKIIAIAEVQSPQGSITINYTFEVQGETLKGEGTLDFGGQGINLNYDLKRTSTDPSAQPAAAAQQPQRQEERRATPQPQQKQSIDYFVGTWTFKYVGRESDLGPAPREGTATFTKRPDGKTLDMVVNGSSEAGAYQESAVITFDDATKMMTHVEKLGSGITLNSKADWRSPLAIRFTVDPVKTKNGTLQLRRTINVVAAHSFVVVEELSEDGGPFVRLGQAIFTKAGS